MRARSLGSPAAALAWCLLPSCVIGDVDFAGHPCSDGACPNGLVCVSGLCQREVLCDAALRIAGLKASWQTPNSIRWEWTVEGDVAQFNGYELTITSDRGSVSGAKIWTPADLPELAHYKLPTTLHPDNVLSTITHGLDEDTPYRASLAVKDRAGKRCTSAFADAHTAVGRGLSVIPIFENGFVGSGTADPFAFRSVPRSGGGSMLEVQWDPQNPHWEPSCANRDTCYQNLHVYGVANDTSGITDATLATSAFFEATVSYVPPAGQSISPSWWSSVGLCLGRQNVECFVYEPFVVRNEQGESTRVIQLPLRMFRQAKGIPITKATLQEGLDNFFIGGEWSSPMVFRVHGIRIRY